MQSPQETRKIVQEFLERHVKMVLAVNDPDAQGYPNASIMHYAVGDDLHMYFGTRRSFGKYAALKSDPKVAYIVMEEGGDPKRVVDGRGIARELDAQETQFAHDYFKRTNVIDVVRGGCR